MKKDTERNKIDPAKVSTYNKDVKFNTRQGGQPGPIMTRDEIYSANGDLTVAVHAVREYTRWLERRAFSLARDSMGVKSCSREALDQIKAAGEMSAVHLQVCEALNALENACRIFRDGEHLEYIEAIKSI